MGFPPASKNKPLAEIAYNTDPVSSTLKPQQKVISSYWSAVRSLLPHYLPNISLVKHLSVEVICFLLFLSSNISLSSFYNHMQHSVTTLSLLRP